MHEGDGLSVATEVREAVASAAWMPWHGLLRQSDGDGGAGSEIVHSCLRTSRCAPFTTENQGRNGEQSSAAPSGFIAIRVPYRYYRPLFINQNNDLLRLAHSTTLVLSGWLHSTILVLCGEAVYGLVHGVCNLRNA
jgi:hypothetical protein